MSVNNNNNEVEEEEDIVHVTALKIMLSFNILFIGWYYVACEFVNRSQG
jgi:hypothetical protein